MTGASFVRASPAGGLAAPSASIGLRHSLTRLRSGGWLLLEHAYDQKDRCVELLLELGYADVGDFQDLAGWPRACAGRWLD